MSDVEIGAISGGSGSFVTQKFFNGQIASGAVGDILTITAPLGKRVRLDALFSLGGSQQGIEIYADDVLVNQSSTELAQSSDMTNGFKVLHGNGTSYNVISDIVGREIVVKSTAGATGYTVLYSYSEGV